MNMSFLWTQLEEAIHERNGLKGEGIMDEERDPGIAAMIRKDRREHTSGHIRRRQAVWLAVFIGVEAEFFELHVEATA